MKKIITIFTVLILLTLVNCAKEKGKDCPPLAVADEIYGCHQDPYYQCIMCMVGFSDTTTSPRCNPRIGDLK